MDHELRSLLRTRTAVKEQRIAAANRLLALESDSNTLHALAVTQKAIYSGVSQDLRTLEKVVTDEIRRRTQGSDLVKASGDVKGASALNLAPFIAYVDITKCERPAQLWRFCGFAVIDGHAEKGALRGIQHFNSELKHNCIELGATLLAAGHAYYAVYLHKRIYYTKERDWSKAHTHVAALRYTIKLFISHVWETWRVLEGLSVCESMNLEWLRAEEFGWVLTPQVQA